MSEQLEDLPIGRQDANHCFVCGPDNPAGMRIVFRLEEGLCKAQYTPTKFQCGFDGVTHGGIIFSLLDDVMANRLFLQGERAYTAKCEIRYREPAMIGRSLLLEGELLSRRGRRAQLAGRVLHPDDDRVLAEAAATFIVVNDEPS
jgi:acyl-coenzyme A thioesterase PaaI-like protein